MELIEITQAWCDYMSNPSLLTLEDGRLPCCIMRKQELVSLTKYREAKLIGQFHLVGSVSKHSRRHLRMADLFPQGFGGMIPPSKAKEACNDFIESTSQVPDKGNRQSSIGHVKNSKRRRLYIIRYVLILLPKKRSSFQHPIALSINEKKACQDTVPAVGDDPTKPHRHLAPIEPKPNGKHQRTTDSP